MQDVQKSAKITKGDFNMASAQCGDEALEFAPILRDVEKKKVNAFSPYKPALFAHDIILAGLTFGFGSWITGLGFFEKESLSYSVVLLALSLVVVAFFSSYNLYNYHLIFLKKKHLTKFLVYL